MARQSISGSGIADHSLSVASSSGGGELNSYAIGSSGGQKNGEGSSGAPCHGIVDGARPTDSSCAGTDAAGQGDEAATSDSSGQQGSIGLDAETDAQSDVSDDSDIFNVEVFPRKSWTTEEDEAILRAQRIGEHTT